MDTYILYNIYIIFIYAVPCVYLVDCSPAYTPVQLHSDMGQQAVPAQV